MLQTGEEKSTYIKFSEQLNVLDQESNVSFDFLSLQKWRGTNAKWLRALPRQNMPPPHKGPP